VEALEVAPKVSLSEFCQTLLKENILINTLPHYFAIKQK
jgi:hypothetical protein